MAVVVECLSVVARVDALERLFPGGLAAYRDQCPNDTFCDDGEIARVGFMTPRDTQLFTGALQRLGFEFLDEAGSAVDFVVVDQFRGPTTPCAWIEFEAREEFSAAWLAGREPEYLWAPPGWEPRRGRFRFVPNAQIDELRCLGNRGGNDVFLDPVNRDEVFVGRPFRDGKIPFEDLRPLGG